MKEIEVALSFWCPYCEARIFPLNDSEPDPFNISSLSLVNLVEKDTVSRKEAREALRRNHMRKHQMEESLFEL